jgi:YlmC/YmxH family sporulation protein
MRLNDFQGKEVINACDGKKLGYIVDFVFDEKCGQIEAIIIPKTSKFCNFYSNGINNTLFLKTDPLPVPEILPGFCLLLQ